MSKRTTLVLDDDARLAARELAHRYGCSTSEAIRRAIVRQRNAVLGIPPTRREERVRILERLFEQFQDNDPAEEVRRLKREMGRGGGYILEPGITIQADVPLENMLALIEAGRE